MSFERRLMGALASMACAAVSCLGLVEPGNVAAGVLVEPARAQDAAIDDPAFELQWGLMAIGAPAVWPVSTGAGVTVAVLDSGASLDHEDLATHIVGAATCVGTNGASDRCVPGGQDDDGHGTHVAGVVAAARNNGRGIAGVAPDASLLIVKVLRESCDAPGPCGAQGTADDVSAGIRYAADQGADVINLSLGSYSQAVFGPEFDKALDYAWERGALPVVAAGNDVASASGFEDEPAIVVGAVDRANAKSTYANGVGTARWALSAPGGEADTVATCESAPQGILSTYWINGADGYACLAGTSMAAPHVAGAAALLRAAGLSPQETVDRLLATAVDLGPAGPDPVFGAGRVDVAAALSGAPAAAAPVAPGVGAVPAEGGVAPGAVPPAAPDQPAIVEFAAPSAGRADRGLPLGRTLTVVVIGVAAALVWSKVRGSRRP
ncbi:MAG: S8 family serine peptidase [Acidimicrobiia bacterium]